MTEGRKGPLAGVRVLDHFGMWAGPLATSLMGGLGAEVIKVESIQRYDGLRLLRVCQPGEEGHEWSAAFNGNNHGKLGITLDLKDPRGRRLFLELAKLSDVVTESYRPDTAAKLGITYQDVAAVRPDVIYITLSGFGASGPWAERPGYGATFSQVAGLAYLNGYGDGSPPIGDGAMWYSDVFNASMAVFSVVTALHYRDRTGQGQQIEQAQIEVTSLMTLEYLLDHSLSGAMPETTGNRRPGPENVYPCLPGEEQEVVPALSVSTDEGSFRKVALDEWVAVSVNSDAEWDALCGVADGAEFTRDPRFRTALGRFRHAAELDEQIAAWTRGFSSLELAERLQARGVPAGAVVNHGQALATDHFHERNEIVLLDRPVTGMHLYAGFPFHFDVPISGWDIASPTLGQHNEDVLKRLVGVSEAELNELVADGVIGNRPVWRPVT